MKYQAKDLPICIPANRDHQEILGQGADYECLIQGAIRYNQSPFHNIYTFVASLFLIGCFPISFFSDKVGYSMLILGLLMLSIWFFARRAHSRLDSKVYDTVLKRPPFSLELFNSYWDNAELAAIALQIREVIIPINWNEDTIFFPNDSFCLMIELYTGDGNEAECIEKIEKKFSLKIPEVEWNEFIEKRITLLDLSRIIKAKLASQRPA
jgi:hypothetical protein